MELRYREWIIGLGTELLGRCAEATQDMVKEFPELKRVRGHYICPIWGRRAHWWCVTPDGLIVDPTKGQFPSGGIGEYIPWIDGEKEPTGICADCGEEVFNGDSFCNDECARKTMEYLNGR